MPATRRAPKRKALDDYQPGAYVRSETELYEITDRKRFELVGSGSEPRVRLLNVSGSLDGDELGEWKALAKVKRELTLVRKASKST